MKETRVKKDSERAQDGDGGSTVCNGGGGGVELEPKHLFPSKNVRQNTKDIIFYFRL